MEFRTKMLEALRNDAEAAADAIDEAQQQLNVLARTPEPANAAGVFSAFAAGAGATGVPAGPKP